MCRAKPKGNICFKIIDNLLDIISIQRPSYYKATQQVENTAAK